MTKTGYIFFITLFCIIVGGGFYLFIQFTTPGETPGTATSTPVTTTDTTYTNTSYGFSINPYDLIATTTFSKSYLILDSWTIASQGSPATGTPIISFVMPGSNEITAAEVRIGVSNDKDEIKNCLMLSKSSNFINEGTTTIGNTVFSVFSLGDAAMSHYLNAKIYRALHNNLCYSLDEVVNGTNPNVYSPRAIPPFEMAEATSTLEKTVKTFTFK